MLRIVTAAFELSNAVRGLCRELGYFGIFEIEFIRFNDGWAAIDFNPRLFNQIGMDICRGMPLPLLARLDAAGETSALRNAVAKAQTVDQGVQTAFCDGFTLCAIVMARTITARMSGKERAYWRIWRKRNAANTVDFAADHNDKMPALIHALSEIYLGLKAFPNSYGRRRVRTRVRTPEEHLSEKVAVAIIDAGPYRLAAPCGVEHRIFGRLMLGSPQIPGVRRRHGA